MIDAEYDPLFDFWRRDFARIQNAEAVGATDIRGALTPESPVSTKSTSLEMMEAGSDILGSLSWYSRECLSQADTDALFRVRKLHQELNYILGIMVQLHNHPNFRVLIEFPARQSNTYSTHESTGRRIGRQNHCAALREELISKHPCSRVLDEGIPSILEWQHGGPRESRRSTDLAFREEERRKAMIVPGPSGSAEFPAYDSSPRTLDVFASTNSNLFDRSRNHNSKRYAAKSTLRGPRRAARRRSPQQLNHPRSGSRCFQWARGQQMAVVRFGTDISRR